ncbi:MAG: hypothetical protein RSC93_01670 [Erysipelotrichaceae bacterium]
MTIKDYELLQNDFDDDIDLLHCDITNWINQIHEQRFSSNLSNIRQRDIISDLKNISSMLESIKKEMNCEGEYAKPKT